MDIDALKGLGTLLLWGALFFFMMRFGCGAHMAGGHGHHGAGGSNDGEDKDPVCGMSVTPDRAKGATVHGGKTFYFCSTSCRDKFEAAPDKYLSGGSSGEHHHG